MFKIRSVLLNNTSRGNTRGNLNIKIYQPHISKFYFFATCFSASSNFPCLAVSLNAWTIFCCLFIIKKVINNIKWTAAIKLKLNFDTFTVGARSWIFFKKGATWRWCRRILITLQTQNFIVLLYMQMCVKWWCGSTKKIPQIIYNNNKKMCIWDSYLKVQFIRDVFKATIRR